MFCMDFDTKSESFGIPPWHNTLSNYIFFPKERDVGAADLTSMPAHSARTKMADLRPLTEIGG